MKSVLNSLKYKQFRFDVHMYSRLFMLMCVCDSFSSLKEKAEESEQELNQKGPPGQEGW